MLGVLIGIIISFIVVETTLRKEERLENDYTELYGLSSKMYSKERYIIDYNDKINNIISKKITDVIISKNLVNIENTGESEYLDVIVEYMDGSYENISDIVNWESTNPNIVFADQGRILALDKGSTEVLVSFAGITKVIKVDVLE